MGRRVLRKRETFRIYRITVLWLSDSKKMGRGLGPHYRQKQTSPTEAVVRTQGSLRQGLAPRKQKQVAHTEPTVKTKQDINEPSVQSLALGINTQEEWKGVGYGNHKRVTQTHYKAKQNEKIKKEIPPTDNFHI